MKEKEEQIKQEMRDKLNYLMPYLTSEDIRNSAKEFGVKYQSMRAIINGTSKKFSPVIPLLIKIGEERKEKMDEMAKNIVSKNK